MKIEKITDTQIRIYLPAEEIRKKGLTLDDLSYGAPETKKVIRSALLEASVDCAFNAKDSNLMVEITPLPEDDLEILITKVDYPDEFDTRYAEFIQAAPEDETGTASDSDMEDFREVTSFPDPTEEYNYGDDLTDMDENSEATPSKEEGFASKDSNFDSKDPDTASKAADAVEDFLSINDPEDNETSPEFSGMTPEGMPAFGDLQEMIKAFQAGELPPGITFAPIDPSQLANLPGFDKAGLVNGQILGGTIIDARTSDGRVLTPQEISGLLKGLISGMEGQMASQPPAQEEDDLEISKSFEASGDPSHKQKAKEAMMESDISGTTPEETSGETSFSSDNSVSDPSDPSQPSDSAPEKKEYNHKNRLVRMFGFDTLDDCIQACSFIAPIFQGDSMVFRAPKQPGVKTNARFGEYILCITNDHCSNREFSLAYNHLFEYNGRRISPKVSFEHIEEHYELMIAKDAIHILKDL